MVSELEKQMAAYQSQLDKSIKLEALEAQAEFEVINEVLDGLIIDFSNAILNGDPADHDTYLVNRAKLDGVRSVRNRFNTIKKNGEQASNAIGQLNS